MHHTAVAWLRKFLYPPPPIRVRAEDLARHGLRDPESALKEFVAWRRERALRFGDGAFKTAALILTPLLAAILDPGKHVGSADIYIVSAAVFSLLGLVWQARAAEQERSLYRESTKLAEKMRDLSDGANGPA